LDCDEILALSSRRIFWAADNELAAASRCGAVQSIPLARSSSISSSLSFADMDRYSAVTEYRFDWRTEREPSCDDIVFWRETGMKDDEEDVEAREGACSMETAMVLLLLRRPLHEA
jgi:hypothetical protein